MASTFTILFTPQENKVKFILSICNKGSWHLLFHWLYTLYYLCQCTHEPTACISMNNQKRYAKYAYIAMLHINLKVKSLFNVYHIYNKSESLLWKAEGTRDLVFPPRPLICPLDTLWQSVKWPAYLFWFGKTLMEISLCINSNWVRSNRSMVAQTEKDCTISSLACILCQVFHLNTVIPKFSGLIQLGLINWLYTSYVQDVQYHIVFEEIVHPKMKIPSLITHPHAVPNLEDLCSSSEHKLNIFDGSKSFLTLYRQ